VSCQIATREGAHARPVQARYSLAYLTAHGRVARTARSWCPCSGCTRTSRTT
jgi:hypothetical protein